MTQQFKFGDRVARKNETPDYDKAFIVISAKDNGEICVFSSISKLPFDLQAKDYQLVPHPDTVRLDWLAKNDCSLTERLCDEDKDLLDTPFAVIQIQENHFEVLAAASNIHDAIDAAMKQEQEK